MLKYVLFDFDGTLVDSREVFIAAYNTIARKHGFREIQPSNLEQLRKLSMLDRFRYLKVPAYRIPFLTSDFLSLYNDRLEEVTLVSGMNTVIQKINELGIRTGIVSSNAVPIIRRFMEREGLDGINDVYCSGKLFGKDRIFRRFLKDKNLQGDQVLYVCDELRDIIACNKTGIRPAWVSWGFETEEAVTTDFNIEPVHTPAALLERIQKECTLFA